jgi:hypothetical protein
MYVDSVLSCDVCADRPRRAELMLVFLWNMMQEKLSRFTEAVLYVTANAFKTLVYKLLALLGFRKPDAMDEDGKKQ